MKKILAVWVILFLMTTLLVDPVFAKTSGYKGEITAIDSAGRTITILTNHNQSLIITTPEDLDLASLAVGNTVIVKGETQSDGSVLAEWVKTAGPDTDEKNNEGKKAGNGAYCNHGKKQQSHPFAANIAAEEGVDEAWGMNYYCDGYSMGAIMLSLKTAGAASISADEILSQRASGIGWGQVWQGQNLIGDERLVNPPPGQLKKME
jgi:hypothetical protein